MPPRLISSRMLEDLFPQPKRSKGRHVSAAIHAIMRRLHPHRFTDEPIDQVRAALGNAIEKAIIKELAKRYPKRYVRPGELFDEGVHGTPDLWDLKPHKLGPAIVEIKLTWASSRRALDIEDPWFWRYWAQGKSYARMSKWKGRTFRRVIVIIVFVVGDWRNGKPEAFAWEDRFNDDELDENWEMVKLYSGEEE